MWSVEGALPQWARRDSTVNDNSVLANASPGPLLIVASRLLRHSFKLFLKSYFKSSFKSYFESSFGSCLLLCLMSSVLSPFIVVLDALAFGCILNFRLTFYTLMRY